MDKFENDHALKSLENIRNIMQRSSKFLSLSGLAGVFAGVFALIGAAVAYQILNWGKVRFSDYGSLLYQPEGNFVTWLIIDGLAVLLFSIIVAWVLTKRKAKRLGLHMWDESAKRMFRNFLIPLATGAIVCCILFFKYGIISLIAPFTLIFYGLALTSASKYSFDELRYLGLLEILLGIASLCFLGFGLIFWALGFGVLHIVYGLIMYQKHQ